NQQDTVIPVIFDEAHLDPGTQNSLLLFDHETAMKKPLDMLSQLDLDGNFQSDFNITINENYFTGSYFDEIGSQGILIMTLLDKKVGSSEGAAIKTWVENGGSVFIATQPDYNGFEYCKVEATNLLLKKLQVYDMFHLYQFQDDKDNYNSDELYDDNDSHLFKINDQPTNSWDIVVTDEQFSTNDLGRSMKEGIDEVLLGVSTIEVNSSDYVGAYSWKESYSVSDVTGDIRLRDEAIPWLAGTKLGKGKVVLLGSTFPVSDWDIYGTTLKFIDQLDNMRLWVNIIKWLAEDTSEKTTGTSATTKANNSFTDGPGLPAVMIALVIISLVTSRAKKK
ncbi:MAG: hypothetical protein ACFFD4_28055, partial [Candidatus Odinarchaeota archaeon]